MFWRRAAEDRVTAGTAFLALRRVNANHQLAPEERERLREMARETAVNGAACESARMAALEILRGAQDPGALPAAHALLKQSPSKAAAIAAIGAIGAMGNGADAQELNNNPNVAADPALQPTLAHALRQLAVRTSGKQ